MKHIKLGMILCALVAFLPMTLWAQNSSKINLNAVVLTGEGEPVQGALIASDLDGEEAISDSNGNFTMSATMNTTLSVSADGYATKLVRATAELQEIVLAPAAGYETVQVAYRDVQSSALPAGVSYVNIPELLEKNYFTYAFDNIGAFAPGLSGNIWGMDNILILVDGVPRDLASIATMEIDQITFLKGVSAVALYGSKAAKGVVLVTTKRGVAGKQKVNIRANAGLNTPVAYPKYLGSAEYMTLYNEARTNDGLSPLYSEEDIYHHAAGTNPYRYPDVDYYDPQYLKDAYSYYDATMEITGGNERAKYYTNIGFVSEGSLLNFGEAEGNRTERYNIRGNVDMKLNDFISAKVDAAAIFHNMQTINSDYWGGAATLRPHRYAPLIPIDMIEDTDEESNNFVRNSQNIIDGKYLLGGSQLHQTNPIADAYAGGKSTVARRQFQFNAGVDADLNRVLKGLSFSTLFGIDYHTTYIQSFNPEYATYEVSWTNYAGKDMIGSLTKFRQDAKTGEQNINGSLYRQTLSYSGQFNYHTSLNNTHNFSAVLVGGIYQQSTSSVYRRDGNANLGLHVGYNFKDKYFVDFNGALIHSAKLPKNNRQAFSPTVSLGWKLSDEGFLASSSTVNHLKLSVTGGILHTDMDIPDFLLYDILYTPSGAWFGWNDGSGLPSTESRRGENQNLTFAKREEVSLGLEAALFDNLITFTGNAFISNMTGLVGQLNNLYPSYFFNYWPESSFVPYVNYNEDQRSGFDFNVNLNKAIGAVDWTLGITGTYYETKALKRAEIVDDEYQRSEGRPLDAIWGLVSDGFFTSQDDIDDSPYHSFVTVSPGDIKYVDQNGDGIVNDQDRIYLGRGGWYGAPLTLGAHLTAKWRNFTFFALGMSRTGAKGMKSSDYFWVNGDDKYSEVVRGRWTESTQSTATFPRLTTESGENNFRNSDFWIYSTDRFDLARVQISYTFPQHVIGSGFVRDLGVYVSGSNLLTIAPNKDLLQMNIGSHPQMRSFNLGVKAQF